MNKEIFDIIELYKKGSVTKYVIEKELSIFMGDRCEVEIVNDGSVSTATSFGIFTLPEMRSNGIYVKYLIDSETLNFLNSEQLEAVLERLKGVQEPVKRAYFNFKRDTDSDVLTLNGAIAGLLKLYLLTLPALSIQDANFLPKESQILDIIKKAENRELSGQDLESLKINDTIPQEVIKHAKEISHDSKNIINSDLSKNGCELPTFNLGYQEVRSLCTGECRDYAHKDIKFDYRPTTNQ